MAVSMPLTDYITAVNRQTKARLLTAQLGNGYIHTAPDGPSNIYSLYTVRWDNLRKTDRDTVVAAIRSTFGSDYFSWTAPGESSSGKYIIVPMPDADLYSETISGGAYYTIEMKLRQIP